VHKILNLHGLPYSNCKNVSFSRLLQKIATKIWAK